MARVCKCCGGGNCRGSNIGQEHPDKSRGSPWGWWCGWPRRWSVFGCKKKIKKKKVVSERGRFVPTFFEGDGRKSKRRSGRGCFSSLPTFDRRAGPRIRGENNLPLRWRGGGRLSFFFCFPHPPSPNNNLCGPIFFGEFWEEFFSKGEFFVLGENPLAGERTVKFPLSSMAWSLVTLRVRWLWDPRALRNVARGRLAGGPRWSGVVIGKRINCW